MTSVTSDRRQGLNSSAAIKVPCRVAATGNIVLSGLQTIDGVALASGDRVLLTAQTDTTKNGIWIADTGNWSRDLDFDGAYDVVKGTLIRVTDGGVNAETLWEITTANPQIGNALAFSLYLGNFAQAAMINYADPLAPAYLKTVSDIINGDQVSLFRFIPRTEHAAIQAGTSVLDVSDNVELAMNTLMAAGSQGGLYVPRGTYLHNKSKIYGNTAATTSSRVIMRGEKGLSAFKTTAAGIIPFTVEGPHPDVDGVGNRHDGRVFVEGIAFNGPGSYGGAKSGTGMQFYGVQGVVLRDNFINGWSNGELYKNTDLVLRDNIWSQNNDYGVNSVSGMFTGIENSFITVHGQCGHNSVAGIKIFGGMAVIVRDVNFTVNGTSISMSNTGAETSVTVNPIVEGNYFEADTGTMMQFGGGSGIVRGGTIRGNSMLVTAGTTAITAANISHAISRFRVYDNSMSVSGGVGVFTGLDDSTSAEKVDYNFLAGTGGANGEYYDGALHQFTKAGVGAGAGVDILKIGSFGNAFCGILSVIATSAGKATTKTYAISMIGSGNTVATVTPIGTQDYSGGASAFHLTDTSNAPVAGTNKLTLTNDSAAACTFLCSLRTIVGSAAMVFM